MKIDEEAIKSAAKRLRRLRLTDVGGRKEHPADTVTSVLKTGLGGLYDDAAVEYILRFGVRYYLEALASPSQKVIDAQAGRDAVMTAFLNP